MNTERKIQFALTCLFLLFFVHSSYANNFKKNQIGIGAGISQYASRDYLVSPLIYSGWGVPFTIYYRYEGNKNIHTIKIFLNQLSTTATGGHAAKNYLGSIHYGYERHLTTFMQNNVNVFAGFVLGLVSSRNILSFETGITTWSASTYADLFSLSLICSGRYYINARNSLETNINIPVFGYAYRPGYSLGPPEKRPPLDDSLSAYLKGGKFIGPFEIPLMNATLSYKRSLSGSLGAGVRYEFEYSHIRDPRPVSTVINKLYFTFFYQFGKVR